MHDNRFGDIPDDSFFAAPLNPIPPEIGPDPDAPSQKPPVKEIPFPVVPLLLPRSSLSYVIATPKTGAKRFILSQLENYAAGLPFMRVPSQAPEFPPEQLGIVVCGCRVADVKNRIERMGLKHLQKKGVCPIVRMDAVQAKKQPEKFPLELAYDLIGLEGKQGDPRFLFVESIQLLMLSGRSNDQQPVGEFIGQLLAFCEEKQCAIIGTAGTSKIRYRKLSQRIAGNSQWGVGASTLIGIETNDKTKIRKIVIQSSEGYEESLGSVMYAAFDDRRRLVPCADPEHEERPSDSAMRGMTDEMEMNDYGSRFTRAELIDLGERHGIGDRLVGDWIAERVAEGMIKPEGNNRNRIYVRVDPAGKMMVN